MIDGPCRRCPLVSDRNCYTVTLQLYLNATSKAAFKDGCMHWKEASFNRLSRKMFLLSTNWSSSISVIIMSSSALSKNEAPPTLVGTNANVDAGEDDIFLEASENSIEWPIDLRKFCSFKLVEFISHLNAIRRETHNYRKKLIS